jgi:hypothetical protein
MLLFKLDPFLAHTAQKAVSNPVLDGVDVLR